MAENNTLLEKLEGLVLSLIHISTNDYARIGSTNKGSNYVKKTFVRMENITLSYSVPKHLLKKIAVQNMRFSLAVRNPFVITGWDFGDPEGGDTTLRTVNFGVNFTL